MVVFAYEAAWRELGDAALDRELWPSARAAGDFLCDFLDGSRACRCRASISGSRRTGSTRTARPRPTAACRGAAMAARHEPALAARYRDAPGECGPRSTRTSGARSTADISARAGSGAPTSSARSRRRSLSGRFGIRRRRSGASTARTRASTARSSASAGRSAPSIPRHPGCAPRSPRSSASYSSSAEACCDTRATTMRAATPGSSRRSGSASPSARPATRRGGRAIEYALARQTPLGLLPEQVTRRRPCLGGPARLESRDARPRRPPRARGRSRRRLSDRR